MIESRKCIWNKFKIQWRDLEVWRQTKLMNIPIPTLPTYQVSHKKKTKMYFFFRV